MLEKFGAEPLTSGDLAFLGEATVPLAAKYQDWLEHSPELVFAVAAGTVFAPRVLQVWVRYQETKAAREAIALDGQRVAD